MFVPIVSRPIAMPTNTLYPFNFEVKKPQMMAVVRHKTTDATIRARKQIYGDREDPDPTASWHSNRESCGSTPAALSARPDRV